MTGPGVRRPMKAGLLVALVASAAMAGCTGTEANPNLAAPKLVVQARPDGNVTLFVHGAFGDRLYDWVALAIDNETRANRSTAFSLEETVAGGGFYFETSAGVSREMYLLRGRADVDAAEERVEVAFLAEDGEWGDPQSFGLPWERVLVRRDAA